MRPLVSLAVALLLLLLLGPLLLALFASLRPESGLLGGGTLLAGPLVLDHYRALFDERDFWVPVRNSLVVAGTTTVLCLAIGSLCAYALARLPFRGRGIVLGGVLTVSMFPQISIVSPLYLALRSVGLIHSFPGLVLPYLTFAMPLCVWLLVATFRQVPFELEEAARLDGAGPLRRLAEVVLPLSLPGVASAAILTFLYCWNEFLFALSFTLGPERHTVPVAIALLRGRYQVPWGQVLAAAVLVTLPLLLLVLVLQRRIVRGLASGAVKG